MAERRDARKTYQRQRTPDILVHWKDAKKKAAQTEEARKESFRTVASEELNRPANLGKVCKILRKMDGGVQATAPGRAINGDHGREAVADRRKA